jgi:uncharacterized protein (TIGR03067 family)
MKVRWLLFTAVAVLAAIAQSGATEGKDDKDKLLGTWILVGLEAEGKAFPEEEIKKIDARLTIKPDRMYWKTASQTDEGTYQIDPSKKPKAINVTSKQVGKMSKGIYQLDGDNFRLCIDISGVDDRPSDFKTEPGKGTVLYTFTRGKS